MAIEVNHLTTEKETNIILVFCLNDGRHCCEIGFWGNEPEHSDQLWSAYEDTMARAVVVAVSRCEVVTGTRDHDEALASDPKT